jgi:L-iditol 2-dehydrogenase
VETDTHILPDHVTFEDATVAEPWGCVVGGLKVSGIQPGDTVAVVGGGFMGQGFIHMAPLFGAGDVFGLDFSDYRLEKALEMGATHTINPKKENPVEKLKDLNHGRGADAVIVTVPNIAALNMALDLVGVGGTLHINAPASGKDMWQINPERLYFDEIVISNKYSADHRDINQVLSWLSSGRITPSKVITHRFLLDDTLEAMRLMVLADRSIKSVIYPNGFEIAGISADNLVSK